MHWRLSVIVISAVVIALSAITAIPQPSQASPPWGPYHWLRASTQPQVPLTILLSVTSQWTDYAKGAVNQSSVRDWDDSDVLALTTSSSVNDTKTRRRCPTVSGKIRACNYTYGFNGWIGQASIWIKSDGSNHISQATAQWNDSYMNQSSYNTQAWRHLVTCHEIGHTFGLDHPDTTFENRNLGACLDYTNAPAGGGTYGPSNEYPSDGTVSSDNDYATLLSIYNHSHSGLSAQQATSPSNKNADKNAAAGEDEEDSPSDPDELGKPTGKKDKYGRNVTFEKDLGNGKKRLTFVSWVEPGKPGSENAR